MRRIWDCEIRAPSHTSRFAHRPRFAKLAREFALGRLGSRSRSACLIRSSASRTRSLALILFTSAPPICRRLRVLWPVYRAGLDWRKAQQREALPLVDVSLLCRSVCTGGLSRSSGPGVHLNEGLSAACKDLGNVGSKIGGGRRVESSCKTTPTVAVSNSFYALAEYPELTTTKQHRQQQQRQPTTIDSTYQLNFVS